MRIALQTPVWLSSVFHEGTGSQLRPSNLVKQTFDPKNSDTFFLLGSFSRSCLGNWPDTSFGLRFFLSLNTYTKKKVAYAHNITLSDVFGLNILGIT